MQSQTISFPQRQIKKSYRSVTGHFPSIKNNRNMAYESTLEEKLFLTLEFDEEVESYIEQPQIQITQNGKVKIYSADCYVKHIDSSTKKDCIIEVKYTTELKKKKNKLEQKFNSIQNAVEKMEIEFTLFTEESFPSIYIQNIDFLYRYKQQKLSDIYDVDILNAATESPISAFNLANSLSKTKQEYFQISNIIWSLVMQGRIFTDLHKEEISMNSLVWKSNECH